MEKTNVSGNYELLFVKIFLKYKNTVKCNLTLTHSTHRSKMLGYVQWSLVTSHVHDYVTCRVAPNCA